MSNALTDPPFAEHPPLKLDVDARVLGLVIGILSVVGAIAWTLVSITGLWVVGSVNAFCSGFQQSGSDCGTTSGVFALGLIGFALVVAGYLLGAVGGFRMFTEHHLAKRVVIYGQLIGVVGGLLAVFGYSGFVSVFIFDVLLAIVVYYLVIVSRFPDEMPLTDVDDPDD